MIVVDSSALVAIFERESDAATFATAIQRADRLQSFDHAISSRLRFIKP